MYENVAKLPCCEVSVAKSLATRCHTDQFQEHQNLSLITSNSWSKHQVQIRQQFVKKGPKKLQYKNYRYRIYSHHLR